MSTEIKAPTFPESVADGSIATWHQEWFQLAIEKPWDIDMYFDGFYIIFC